MKVILVLSSWSSGSTAVTGFLDKCGCFSCPPHLLTADSKTPNAFEPQEYRDALAACIEESTLQPKEPADHFVKFMAEWLPKQIEKAEAERRTAVVLKHPLQTLLLNEISSLCDPSYVVVTRPLDSIEGTRQRRGWIPAHGAAGAEVIYSAIYSYLQDANKTYLGVAYEMFRTSEDIQHKLLQYCGLDPAANELEDAKAWLR